MYRFIAAVTTVILLGSSIAETAITPTWVMIDNRGNPADPLVSGTIPNIGSVAYRYAIGKYEVTNTEYVAFLNSVDPQGTNLLNLFNSKMSVNPGQSASQIGGIDQDLSAAAGARYKVKAGKEDQPVIWVSWNDAARMANWLCNGKISTGTENGAYDMSQAKPTRNPGAVFALPTSDEWYKAAYYQPASAGGDTDSYWLYPTQTNTVPTSNVAPGGVNSANFLNNAGVKNVGSYTSARNYYGTFDQGGNVAEWTDSQSFGGYTVRGASYTFGATDLRSTLRGTQFINDEFADLGFRLAITPEPGFFALVSLPGLLLYRRRMN